MRRIIVSLVAVLMLGSAVTAQTLTVAPGNEHFQRTWERTDQPVLDGVVPRTWMWGPEAFTNVLSEPYVETPGGQREVQYFDKARMEITAPGADSNSAFYVTNGLLVVELITGQMQTGHASFVDRSPAEVNVAGDAGDPDSPTYATFASRLDDEPLSTGSVVTRRIDRAGNITDDPSLAGQGITVAIVDDVTNHSIVTPFWEFMNSTGPVSINGQITTEALFENPYFATGRPIAEPAWATVPVGGTDRDVLIQCFERRCLTHTPGNPEGFVNEAGNVGQHYYDWRYSDSEPPAQEGVLADVVEVIDGDTIDVMLDGTLQRVRYIGSDTPEISFGVECYGPEARDANASLVAGQTVRLVKDVSEVDGFDRLLRYVWVGDTFVNDWLIRSGFARSMTVPPDVRYSQQFNAAQTEAMNADRGLWSTCDANNPPIPTPTAEPPSSGNPPAEGGIVYQSSLGDWPARSSTSGAIGEPSEAGNSYVVVGAPSSALYVFGSQMIGAGSYELQMWSIDESGTVAGCLVVRSTQVGGYHLCLAFAYGSTLGTLQFYLDAVNGEVIDLGTYEFVPPPSAEQFHTVKLITEGSDFWFYANGELVGTASHGTGIDGLFGIGMICLDDVNLCGVGYRNLVVRSLSASPPGEQPPPSPTATAPPAPTATSPSASCHPSYPDHCIAPPPPDLNCPDLPSSWKPIRVLHNVANPDPHGFDNDGDGWGCDSG